MNWQPIETAPIQPFNKEKWFVSGERFLLWVPNYVVIGQYNYTQKGKGRWQSWTRNINPTHWMPMPQPPAAQEKE